MRTKKTDKLPFSMRKKKVLDRKVDGPNVLVMGSPENDYVETKPQDLDVEFDKRVAAEIADKEFILEGWIAEEKFYACDILYFDGEDLRGEPWNERYKYLINKFDWNYSARHSRAIVVTSDGRFDEKEEVKDAAMIFKQLPDTEGMMVRDYDSKYNDERKFIPVDEYPDEW